MTVVINGTSGITDVNGSAAAPAITGTDTDTGVFFGTNTVSLSTGGTERLQVDSSGNLGLGVTPSAWTTYTTNFQNTSASLASNGVSTTVLGTNWYYDGQNRYRGTGLAALYFQTAGQHAWFTAASGTAGNILSSLTQAMTLDASGNLGIGTTSPSYRLEVRDTADAVIALVKSGANSLRFLSTSSGGVINQVDNNPLAFYTNNTERARIDSSGNLLVGTTSTAYTNTFTVASGTGNGKFAVSAYNNDTTSPRGFFYQAGSTSGDYAIYFGVSGTAKFYVNGAGNVYGTGAYNTISDASLKTNVRPLETGLAEVLSLQPRRFDWIDGSKSNVAGFIAQEVEQVIPDLIVDWKKGAESEEVYKAISVTDMIPTMVKAIQEQQAIITQLQADVAALKGQA